MKEMNDDELQQWLEEQNTGAEPNDLQADMRAYRNLFELLAEEPADSLPYGFSRKVAARIQGEKKRERIFGPYVLMLLIFAVLLAAIYALTLVYSPKSIQGLLSFKWIFILCPAVFMLIQHLDQKLIKRHMFKG